MLQDMHTLYYNREVNMKEKSITTPVNSDVISNLIAGDKVLISGIIYTARDAAHKRLVNLIDNDNEY